MKKSMQMLMCASLALLGVALPVREALAQNTAAPAATSEATGDHERPCRDYDNAVVGPVAALSASQLFSSYEPGVPMGFGLDVPVSYHLSLGVEATYHYLRGEIFSSNTTNGIDGGDLTTFNLVARLRL